jgi:hypothetical protein
MTISDVLLIAAVICGPILAVQTQKIIENWKERRGRKLAIFKTLMATRGTPLSPPHVEALNMIALEFSLKDSKDQPVLSAWKLYLDHLYDVPRDYLDPNYQSKLNTWTDKSSDHRINLLYAMSKALGYTFDAVELKKGTYTPQAYTDLEFENYQIRRGVLDVLSGKTPLPVKFMQETTL